MKKNLILLGFMVIGLLFFSNIQSIAENQKQNSASNEPESVRKERVQLRKRLSESIKAGDSRATEEIQSRLEELRNKYPILEQSLSEEGKKRKELNIKINEAIEAGNTEEAKQLQQQLDELNKPLSPEGV